MLFANASGLAILSIAAAMKIDPINIFASVRNLESDNCMPMSNASPQINSIHGSAIPNKAIGKFAVKANDGGLGFTVPILTIPAKAKEEPMTNRKRS